jgi:hypothetical protein
VRPGEVGAFGVRLGEVGAFGVRLGEVGVELSIPGIESGLRDPKSRVQRLHQYKG